MPIFLILLRKIKKMGIHSLFSFAAAGGESLLRQAPKGDFRPPGKAPRAYYKSSPRKHLFSDSLEAKDNRLFLQLVRVAHPLKNRRIHLRINIL